MCNDKDLEQNPDINTEEISEEAEVVEESQENGELEEAQDSSEEISFEAKKKSDPRNIIILGLLVVLIAAAIVLVILVVDKNKDGNSKADDVTEQVTGPTKRSGEFDIDYEKQVKKLCDYKKVPVAISCEYEINDAVKQQYFEQILDSYGINKYKKVEGRTTVEEGDIADIDYTGYKDGVAFDGGQASGIIMDVSNNCDSTGMPYIEGFSDPIIGMSIGETKKSEITFPEDYGNADLAGATVTFEYKVNDIYINETITIDDISDEKVEEAFGQTAGITTADALRDQIDVDLNQMKYSATVDAVKNYMLDNCEVDIPDGYLDARLNEYKNSFVEENVPDGETLESYLESSGMGISVQQLEDNWRETLIKQIKIEFIFGLIAQKEGVEIDEEVFNEYMDYILSAGQGRFEDYESLYKYFGSGNKEEGEKYLKSQYLVNKAIDIVSEDADVSFEETEEMGLDGVTDTE